MARPERQMRNLAQPSAALIVAGFLSASCDPRSPPSGNPETGAQAPTASTSTSAAPSAPSAVPEGKTTASAAASASAAPAEVGDAASLAGTWEGSYQAKRGEVMMPPKVSDKDREKDDGKTATGAGTLTLTVAPDGDVKGKNAGPLGSATLIGRVEGDVVSCKFEADDPAAKNGMYGYFFGSRKDDRIIGELRVAGPDATMVRKAEVELRKK